MIAAAADLFRQHCVRGIRNFVQTAVVIDNEAHLDENGADTEGERPRRATRLPSSILYPEVATEKSEHMHTSLKQAPDGSEVEDERRVHALNAKTLTDAFHRIEVVCGLYKPTPGEEAVGLATKAAQHADIVILDWYLDEGRNSRKAKDVIRSILTKDGKENGRLRLIAIYTGENDLPGLAKEVFEDLAQVPDAGRSFGMDHGGKTLTRGDARICFLNKPNTPLAEQSDIVAEADLPERLINEFAIVTEGILATFAVDAIAAVRRAAHHIVSVFRKELDGAYLAHRCRLPDPDDAKEFGTELVLDELRNVITMADVADKCMNAEVLKAWVDHVAINNNYVFRNHRVKRMYSNDDIKNCLEKGLDGSKTTLGAKGLKDIESVFFSSRLESWRRSLEFARLSSLKREPLGRTRFPRSWQPTLALGTIVKVLRPATKREQALYKDLPADYLVCVQPRCHSVRLKVETAFPFQIAVPNEREFNLVIKHDNSEGTELFVSWEPRDAVMIRFKPDTVSSSVRASQSAGEFIFVDSRRRRFLWLGDIKDMKAQRNASELAQHIHTAAVDDFEWLRLAAEEGKIDFEGKSHGDLH